MTEGQKHVNAQSNEVFYSERSAQSSSSCVSFDSVTFREYDITIGDNPACSSGAPISIDWEYSKETTFPLDEYEATKPPPREKTEMLMPSDLRHEILKEWDHSFSTIVKATMETQKEREYRANSRLRFHRRVNIKRSLLGVIHLPALACHEKEEDGLDVEKACDNLKEQGRECYRERQAIMSRCSSSSSTSSKGILTQDKVHELDYTRRDIFLGDLSVKARRNVNHRRFRHGSSKRPLLDSKDVREAVQASPYSSQLLQSYK